ncbi:protein kinase, putative [Trypanosoma cruzi marinkellei]|uniref:Protein kinase, putative n=1 Tax=Trypanosoma cruzi marinkellei TaxID=85056 RepID=K2MYU0_TRYCR|nr:protein kinase, putative [Trypanosoma cruzi marinkellei]
MFQTANSSTPKLNFEKRVIGASLRLHRDAHTGINEDCIRSSCNNVLLVSHSFNSPQLSSTIRSTHSGGLEVLTADPPLLLDLSISSASVRRRKQSRPFFGSNDDFGVEDDNVVVEARESHSSLNGSRTFESCPGPTVSTPLEAETLPTLSVTRLYTSSPEKRRKSLARKERGNKSALRRRTGSVPCVTHNSVTRSQDSEGRGLMHVSLAHKALIGKGSFGVVFQAMDRDTNHIIAVKEISFSAGSESKVLKAVRKELALLKLLDHPHIVKCLGEECEESCLRIYMEYVSGGSISSVLRTFGPFQEKQASIYTRQMLEGLEYLHSKNIMHRDLKGDNLLVDPNGTLKISDFGTAKDLLDPNASTALAGTAYFMAPEVILSLGVGLPSDVWSVGCCVIEMLTGSPPFSGVKNQYSMMMRVAETEGELFPEMIPKGQGLSAGAKSFLRRCLQRDPLKRATAKELLDDPWIVRTPEARGSGHCSSRSSNGAFPYGRCGEDGFEEGSPLYYVRQEQTMEKDSPLGAASSASTLSRSQRRAGTNV